MASIDKEKNALIKIKAFIDSYVKGSITIDVENIDCLEPYEHNYGINVIMSIIRSIVYEGLDLSIPLDEKGGEK